MKSIKQIFKDEPELMNNDAVIELIDYCRELEGEVMENKMVKQYSFEDKLTILVQELYNDVKNILQQEEDYHDPIKNRYNHLEKPDFKSAFGFLLTYFKEFSRNEHFIFK